MCIGCCGASVGQCTEQDRAGRLGDIDSTLCSSSRALNEKVSVYIPHCHLRRRIVKVEAGNEPSTNLSAYQCLWLSFMEGECLFLRAHKPELSCSPCERITCDAEGANHVNDYDDTSRLCCTGMIYPVNLQLCSGSH